MNFLLVKSFQKYEKLISLLKDNYQNSFLFFDEIDEKFISELEKHKPEYIFVPHWSHIIEDTLTKKFKFVIFHMTDLPFGRGGSPLQNLIINGIKETKISAFLCNEYVDAGPIYLKHKLALNGTAKNIFKRSQPIIYKMINEIIKKNIDPIKQSGKISFFKRRNSKESDISLIQSLEMIYDYIRMLDDDDYPKAYICTKKYKIEFTMAKKETNSITAKAEFKLK